MIGSSSLKQSYLVAFAVALLMGGVLLHGTGSMQTSSDNDALTVLQTEATQRVMSNHFAARSVQRYSFDRSGQALFDLHVAHYLDEHENPRNAILFPPPPSDETLTLSPTGLRHDIWQETARMLNRKAPENALFLSWWDDGQRIHFLSGRQSWVHAPPRLSVDSPSWQALKADMPEADAEQ